MTKLDPRQKKTRQAILEACSEILKTKDIEQMTINEIAREANINRGTFYLHFKDKYDMITSFEDEMIGYIDEIIIEHMPTEDFEREFLPSRYDTIITILGCFEKKKLLMGFLINSSFNTSFQEKLEKKLYHIMGNHGIYEHIENLKHNIPLELAVKIFTSIFLNVAEYLYKSPDQLDIDQFAESIFKFILQGPAKTMGFIK